MEGRQARVSVAGPSRLEAQLKQLLPSVQRSDDYADRRRVARRGALPEVPTPAAVPRGRVGSRGGGTVLSADSWRRALLRNRALGKRGRLWRRAPRLHYT
jgi:hypothetical protein